MKTLDELKAIHTDVLYDVEPPVIVRKGKPDPNTPCFIYVLIDPITDEIRYVGKSIDPRVRYIAHIVERYGEKGLWVEGLAKQCLIPRMCVIHETILEGSAKIEKDYSYLYKEQGHPLLNSLLRGKTYHTVIQHGTRSSYMRGCRCEPCRQANSDYQNERQKAKAKKRNQ